MFLLEALKDSVFPCLQQLPRLPACPGSQPLPSEVLSYFCHHIHSSLHTPWLALTRTLISSGLLQLSRMLVTLLVLTIPVPFICSHRFQACRMWAKVRLLFTLLLWVSEEGGLASANWAKFTWRIYQRPQPTLYLCN